MKITKADGGYYLQFGRYLLHSALLPNLCLFAADSGDEKLTQWFSLGKVKHFDEERRVTVNAYMLIIWRWVLILGSTRGVSTL